MSASYLESGIVCGIAGRARGGFSFAKAATALASAARQATTRGVTPAAAICVTNVKAEGGTTDVGVASFGVWVGVPSVVTAGISSTLSQDERHRRVNAVKRLADTVIRRGGRRPAPTGGLATTTGKATGEAVRRNAVRREKLRRTSSANLFCPINERGTCYTICLCHRC